MTCRVRMEKRNQTQQLTMDFKRNNYLMNRGQQVLLALMMTFLSTGMNSPVKAQERLIPLWTNPVLVNQKIPVTQQTGKLTLTLPFIEDFSDGKWYPSPQRWSDAMVFVNDDYPLQPPSIGVATFDAIDAFGAVYPGATAFPFPADTLTSHEIDLSSYRQSDSVFMSFHYQAAGIGNAPERDDSLLLEFWSESEQKWFHAWADRGRSYSAFVAEKGKPFGVVVLPVDSTLFFSGAFRFRFRNYASITDFSLPDWGGNVDMWHLDYIVINSNRSIHDSLINNDIAFRDYPGSLLRYYRSMPWNQYLANPSAEMMSNPEGLKIPYSAYYYNLTNPINQSFEVRSLTGGTSYTPGPYNYGNLVLPVDTIVIPKPSSGFGTFVFAAPSAPYADFEIAASIAPFSMNETIRSNDTVRYYQRFYNYYAYDDGSAEAGYGLSSSNPNARLSAAQWFDLNVPDTLRSVRIFFNQTKDLANDEEFTLIVWSRAAGTDTIPGDTLCTQEELRPVFVPGLNQYMTYVLDRPVAVSGSFFIGWEQKTGTMLNIGYDRNHHASDRLRFNIGDGWNKSQLTGALMIRPVLGDSTEAIVSVPEMPVQKEITLYPNPASDRLYIGLGDEGSSPTSELRIEFFNTTGQLIHVATTTEGVVDVSGLRNGLVLVRITDTERGVLLKSSRVLISRQP
jgi:hypothetical protein